MKYLQNGFKKLQAWFHGRNLRFIQYIGNNFTLMYRRIIVLSI